MTESIDNYDKWLERGERLGLSGTELQNYVTQQQSETHDPYERARRRADEREALLHKDESEKEEKRAEQEEKRAAYLK